MRRRRWRREAGNDLITYNVRASPSHVQEFKGNHTSGWLCGLPVARALTIKEVFLPAARQCLVEFRSRGWRMQAPWLAKTYLDNAMPG